MTRAVRQLANVAMPSADLDRVLALLPDRERGPYVTQPIADPDPALRSRLEAEWAREMSEPFLTMPDTELTAQLDAEWAEAMGGEV